MSAYEAGWMARLDGEPIGNCPYNDGRKLAWRNGWRDADTAGG